MKAIDYLTKFANDWACKEPEMQERILNELFKDWCDNFGGVGGARAQSEWKAALADADLRRYIDAKRQGWQRFGDVANRVARGIPNGK
jgi:hypothetical protein